MPFTRNGSCIIGIVATRFNSRRIPYKKHEFITMLGIYPFASEKDITMMTGMVICL